jgi:hypothetical protein
MQMGAMIIVCLTSNCAYSQNETVDSDYKTVQSDEKVLAADKKQLSKDSNVYEQYDNKSRDYANILSPYLKNKSIFQNQAKKYMGQNILRLQGLRALVEQDKYNLYQDSLKLKHDNTLLGNAMNQEMSGSNINQVAPLSGLNASDDATDACFSFGDYGYWPNPKYSSYLLSLPKDNK